MPQHVEPKAPGRVDRRRSGGLRPLHTLGVVALGVVGVIVAFWVLSSIVGLVWAFVKVAVLVALVGGAVWLLLLRRRR